MTNQPGQPASEPPPQIEQAMAFHRNGDLANAESLYRQFLNDHPGHADANHLLGVVALQRGRVEESVNLIGEAVRLDPEHAFYRNSLGEAHRMQGQLGKAEREYRAALKLLPDYPQALGNLGMILHAGGDFEEAISLFQRAIEHEPGNWDLHNNLGVAHQALGELAVAIDCFEKTIELQPQHAEASHNLSTAHKQNGNLGEAREAGEKCVRLAPDVPQAQWNLADIYAELGLGADAEPRCRRAIELDPANAVYHNTLARIVRELGRVAESITHNQRALSIDSTLVQAHNDLGVSYLAMGDSDAALLSLTQAVELAPDFALAYENIAKCKKYTNDDLDFINKINLLSERLESAGDTSGLYFALGKIHDDMGDYSSAFEFYARANASKRAGFQYNPEHQDAWTARLLQIFDASLVDRLASSGHSSQKPIFVLGMPRSGTSLVEQILASHTDVFGAGELTHFYDFTQALPQRLSGETSYPDCVAATGENEMQWMATTYLKAIDGLAPTARYVTDKMPMNFLHLGLIAATFPNAKIVLCERDARDVCLSIYFQNFAARNLFAYDLYDIGRFYRQYLWTIDHWVKLFGERIVHLPYEDLVADQEGVCRKLLGELGLTWDENCLHFYRTERAVQTASSWQVRQPIQAGSVGRWRCYESCLGSLEAGLEGLPPPTAEVSS